MKRLWQSKRFRKNLYKWLGIYIGILGLMTTVITYSRYISSMGYSDSARVAKFIVDVDFTDACAGQDTCDMKTYRPTENITYNFKIKTDLEVLTDLVLTMYVPDIFDIASIQDNEGNDITLTPKTTCSAEEATTNPMCQDRYRQSFVPVANKETTYTLVLKYNKKDFATVDDKDKYSIIIGYSAIQKTR